MHVALYTPAWPSEGSANGIVTYVDVLRRELIRRGVRVTLLTGSPGFAGSDEGVVSILTSMVTTKWRAALSFAQYPVLLWGRDLAQAARRIHQESAIDVFEMEESFGWVGAV